LRIRGFPLSAVGFSLHFTRPLSVPLRPKCADLETCGKEFARSAAAPLIEGPLSDAASVGHMGDVASVALLVDRPHSADTPRHGRNRRSECWLQPTANNKIDPSAEADATGFSAPNIFAPKHQMDGTIVEPQRYATSMLRINFPQTPESPDFGAQRGRGA